MGSFRYAAKVRAVDAYRKEDCGGEKESRDYGSWIGIMRPVGGIETRAPLDVFVFLGEGVIGG
jgi:hypothetical protein